MLRTIVVADRSTHNCLPILAPADNSNPKALGVVLLLFESITSLTLIQENSHGDLCLGVMNSRRLNGSNGIRRPRSEDQDADYQIGGSRPANVDSSFSRPPQDGARNGCHRSSSVVSASVASYCFGRWCGRIVEFFRVSSQNDCRVDD
jgi:hypothetical protein